MAVPNPFDKEALSTLLGGTAAFGTYGSIPPEAHLPFSQLPLNTKTHMSSLRGRHLASPPTIFPPRAAPPHNLPIRVAPNTEALAHLDALYHDKVCQGHKPVGVLDQTNGRDEPPRETRSEEALIALEKHMKDRLPYVQLASRRLQAVVGERNEMRFELPSASLRSGSIPMNPGFGGNVNLDAGGRASRAVARGSPGYAGASPSVTRKDDAMGLSVPRSPTGMFPAVDKKTGKGLREFLLQKGKEFGMRKRECKSISLHDFTPKGPTESFSNVLLGHYGADRGERVDVYEVDLPTTTLDPSTGAESHTTETWVWFLISRPILSITLDDKSTMPPPESPSPSPGSSRYQTPFSSLSNLSFPAPSITTPPFPLHPTPPPNFPLPLPTSWLVIALPLAYCAAYPESTEKDICTCHTSTTKSPYPFMAAHPPVPKHIHKRRDYDLSFQGIPIFEFSSSDLFTTACGLEFLSVEGIGPWYDADQFVEYGKEEYAEVVRAWEDAGRDLCWDSDDELDRVGGGGEGEESRLGLGVGGVRGSRIREMPAPNRGVWWEVFYKRMYGDCRVWERVKTSMGRSNCRVVVRWVERESTEDDESGLDTGGVGESGRGRWRALKGKERMAAGKHARMTRSQTRSRSALALGGESSSGIVIGVGESARSRALGNKDLTKAKVRKR